MFFYYVKNHPSEIGGMIMGTKSIAWFLMLGIPPMMGGFRALLHENPKDFQDTTKSFGFCVQKIPLEFLRTENL